MEKPPSAHNDGRSTSIYPGATGAARVFIDTGEAMSGRATSAIRPVPPFKLSQDDAEDTGNARGTRDKHRGPQYIETVRPSNVSVGCA